MKDHHCKQCGQEVKNRCQWKDCEDKLSDTRSVVLARMNPWNKYLSIKICQYHLNELLQFFEVETDEDVFIANRDDGLSGLT